MYLEISLFAVILQKWLLEIQVLLRDALKLSDPPVSFGLNDFIIEGISLMSKEFIQALLLHEKVSALLIGLQIEAKKLN